MVFLWIIVPYILIMNLLIFGTCIFSSYRLFFESFFFNALYFFIIYAIFGSVAVLIHKRIPNAGDLFKRISIMLPVFYLMNIGALHGAFYLYKYNDLFDCKPVPDMLWYTILYGCIMSTVITFINEGMANWEKWKDSLAESDKLKNSYQRSKLLGLKGQINPHFLFNCFNTLSGLISENEEQAEKFLNEMTKVHRYLLRSDDDYLVSLRDEMKFAQSYLYLIKARFGDAIQISTDLSEASLNLMIPPLSMQVILENIIYTNALNKKEPLQIQIESDSANQLNIIHSLHEKTIISNLNVDEGLDNLMTKYKLLNSVSIQIKENGSQRNITLPLFQTRSVQI